MLWVAVAFLISAPGKIEVTINDGPNYRVTPKILDVLDRHCVKARWFISGNMLRDRRHRPWLKEIVRRGHSLGNHLWSHLSPCKIGVSMVLRELKRTEKMIYQLTNIKTRRYRPPYGHMCKAVSRAVRREGYGIYLWDVCDQRKSAALTWKRARTILKRRGKVVLLFHKNWMKLDGVLDMAAKEGYIGCKMTTKN